MKKLSYLIVLTLILGLVLTGCLLSNVGQVPTTEQSGITYLTKHTEGDPFRTDLIADGRDLAIDVGDVLVWNDGDYLYVKYVIIDPEWCITETHLHIFTDNVDFTDITLKNGNPPPGKFDYKGEHDCLADYTYTIPLDWDPETELFIAAHAVVKKVETISECLVSGADSDNVLYLEEGTPVYPVGYTANYQTYSGTPTPSVLAWTHSAWAPHGVAGAEWISSSYYTENTDNNTWRLFTRSFTLPANAVNISGTLTMNCDNAEEAYLNGNFVGDGFPAIVYGGSLPSGGGRHGWDSVENWDISSQLMAGSNELWTMTRNYGWDGGSTGNPTGLIYKLCYEYDLVTEEEETAWAAGFDFPGKNWATYFTYEVQYEAELILENKDSEWNVIVDDTQGTLEYNLAGPTFDFRFSAEGLSANTAYSLIYYADPWAGDHPGALIGTFTSDGTGNIASTSDSVDLGIDLPDSADANYPGGAKIWLVLSGDYNSGLASIGPMTGWNPTEYLFEHNLITYDDTDV